MRFRAFQIIVGVLMLGGSLWLAVDGAINVAQVASGAAATTTGMELVAPALKIALGLLLAGAYYWAVWSQSNMKRSLENIFAIENGIACPGIEREVAFADLRQVHGDGVGARRDLVAEVDRLFRDRRGQGKKYTCRGN